LLTNNGEDECYGEALQVENNVKWELTMNKEIEFLIKNQT